MVSSDRHELREGDLAGLVARGGGAQDRLGTRLNLCAIHSADLERLAQLAVKRLEGEGRGQLGPPAPGLGQSRLKPGALDGSLVAIEERQGLMVACLEEVAFNMGFIGKDQVARAAERLNKTEYGRYLQQMLDEHA